MAVKKDEVFLAHILEEIKFIRTELKALDFEAFSQNEILKRAVARSLEIIGEAAKNLSKAFQKAHPEIEWKKLAGLRDKLIHQYFGINWDIVWDVVKNKLPEVESRLSDLS